MKLDCDVLIIGGGINGCGIAADAATRGLKVILCEKDDLAQATSSHSSKLIHGGLRYLENYQFGLVRKALKERECLLRLSPNLIHPQRFVLPYQKHLRPFWILRLGLFIYDHLCRTSVSKTRILRRNNQDPYFSPLIKTISKGFCYYDAMTDDARLVITNALQAQKYGAEILTQTRFVKASPKDHHWTAFVSSNGKERQITTRVLINAAGPWVNEINQQVNLTPPIKLSHIKGSHLITKSLYEGEHAYILQHSDNRIIFVIPYLDDFSLIGTTDVNYQGSLDDVSISEEETDYLCQLSNQYFEKKISRDDIIYSYSGVRPLIDDPNESAKNVSRDYKLHLSHPEKPLINVYGGKVTTYRKLAEQCIDLLQTTFSELGSSITHSLPLPGGDIQNFSEFCLSMEKKYHWIPKKILSRYCRNYGSRMSALLENCNDINSLGKHFGHGLYSQEVDFLKKNEWAKNADDILWRRTQLGLYLSSEQRNQISGNFS